MKYRHHLDPRASWFPALACILAGLLVWLTFAGCTVAQCRAGLVLATAADAGTTQAGLNVGASEANPVLKSNPVVLTLAASAVLAIVAEWCLAHELPMTGLWLYRAGVVVHGGAATSNAIQLSRKP